MFLALEPPAAETPNPIVPLWQEIVVGGIAFFILFMILRKFVFPKMDEVFRARVDAIEGGLRRAEDRQAEAEALFAKYQAQLAQARSEAGQIREEARADAEGIRVDVLAKAREESDRIIAAGKEQLQAERQTLVRELRGELGSLAVELAGKIVGESLTEDARQRGTVDRFLSQLETTAGRS